MNAIRNSLIVMCLALMLSACSRDYDTMENFIAFDTLYTPVEKVFPGSLYDEINIIRVTGKDTIYGSYKRDFSFHSFDGLKTSVINQIPYGYGREILYYDQSNLLTYTIDGVNGFQIQESLDYGKTFHQKMIKDYTTGGVSTMPVFADKDHGVFISQRGNTFDINAISVNSFEKINSLNMGWEGYYYPKLLTAIDSKNIFFIGYEATMAQNNYIYHSDDGGYSWQRTLIETMPPINNYNDFNSKAFLEVISKNKYVFYTTWYEYDDDNKELLKDMTLYYTYDGGVNWSLKSFNFNGFINSIQFVNEKVGFILVRPSLTVANTRAHIYKTTDSGETWTPMEKQVFASSIYFEDENTGIATYDRIVQITHDGGKTWKLLTFDPHGKYIY
jgi:photosystem II stability/assembly factor-like uncharacterized protein